MSTETTTQATEPASDAPPCSTVCESQWSLKSGMHVNVHQSELEDAHVGVSFIGFDATFSVDLSMDDLLHIRDELTRIATDVFRADDTIKCPACGYSWLEAQANRDHRNCRRFPFFPDERGKTYAVSR